MCNIAVDKQEQELKCHVIKDNLTAEDELVLAKVQYSDIFSDTEPQKNITNLYIQIRNKLKPTTGNNIGQSG